MTISWGRSFVASALTAFVVALVVHAANLLAFAVGYLGSSSSTSYLLLGTVSNFYALGTVFVFILLIVGGVLGMYRTWWTGLLTGLAAGLIAIIAAMLVQTTGSNGAALSGTLLLNVIATLLGQNLPFVIFAAVVNGTLGVVLYRAFIAFEGKGRGRRLAFVRIPAANLAEGLVTHIARQPVDQGKADEQWDAYVSALAGAGWQTMEIEATDTLPDSVFVEDTAVVLGSTAVITNPGAVSRRAETATTEASLRAQGLIIEHIQDPGTLDGGDVLQIGDRVYVGRGGRTNAEGIRQLRAIAGRLGRTVIAVPTTKALHLKSSVTALPDGTVIGHPGFVDDPGVFERFLAVPEPEGAHVVVLDHDTVLMSAAAPLSAELIGDLGYRVITVDIGEFEKLEGCVTCLSILVR
ncbi:MAG TPA: arginine deiminase family protein [Humibacter sp.]|nr:arginine deiminase family protein [Humibacter sp.]